MKTRNKVCQIISLFIGIALFGFYLFLLITENLHFHNAVQVASFVVVPFFALIATPLALFAPKFGGLLLIVGGVSHGILLYAGYPNDFPEKIAGYFIYSVPMVIAGILWLRSGAPWLRPAVRGKFTEERKYETTTGRPYAAPSINTAEGVSPGTTANRTEQSKKTNWVKVNGIFNIIIGNILCLCGLGVLVTANLIVSTAGWQNAYRIVSLGSIGVTLGVIALAGGIQTIKRRIWRLAVAATIASSLISFVIIPIAGLGGFILVFVFFGLPSIISLISGKAQFATDEPWVSKVGGICTLAAGIGTTIIGLVVATTGNALTMEYALSNGIIPTLSITVIIVGMLAIFGGIFAWRKSLRSLALAGFIYSIILFILMVIFAIILWF